jgi:hypothetical protein
MGPCNSLFSNKKSHTQPPIDKVFTKGTYLQPAIEKKINLNAILENISNTTIIRSISEINGDAIRIEKCKDSTIIIMDYSGQVNINECINCTFFIAPCKGSIYLIKSSKIKLIGASSQFRCRDVSDSKISIFSASRPALERVTNLEISCFCFMYTELQEMFSKSELSIWDNCWSEYTKFSKSDDPHSIKYFEVKSDSEFLAGYNKALKDQEISLDQYYPVPYTSGMSHSILKESNHMLVVLREAYVDTSKLGELLKMELLTEMNINLIKTCIVQKENNSLTELENILRTNKNIKSEFFSSNYASNGAKDKDILVKKTNINIKEEKNINMTRNNFILLWFVTDEENFDTYKNILENELEHFVCIVKKDFEDESKANTGSDVGGKKKIKDILRMLFNDYDI